MWGNVIARNHNWNSQQSKRDKFGCLNNARWLRQCSGLVFDAAAVIGHGREVERGRTAKSGSPGSTNGFQSGFGKKENGGESRSDSVTFVDVRKHGDLERVHHNPRGEQTTTSNAAQSKKDCGKKTQKIIDRGWLVVRAWLRFDGADHARSLCHLAIIDGPSVFAGCNRGWTELRGGATDGL